MILERTLQTLLCNSLLLQMYKAELNNDISFKGLSIFALKNLKLTHQETMYFHDKYET